MNCWNIDLLCSLWNVRYKYNVVDGTYYDYLRIIDLNRIKYEQTAQNVLFFLTYSLDSDVENGFIIQKFDLREHATEVIKKNSNFTFVIDEATWERLDSESKKARIIVVDDILDSINKLYDYTLQNKKYQVVAVTGSVGKTTAVGLIEAVLSKKYQVLRIYSKRITPIILKANIINFLTEQVEYIVLEMSIYHANHVEVLSDLLRPDIAALINIDSSHLEFFKSVADICIHKASIFRYAKVGFVNQLDEIAKNLHLKNHDLYYENECIYQTNLEQLLPIMTDYQVDNEKIIVGKYSIKLSFLSHLSIVQALLAYQIGLYCHIDEKDIIQAIEKYKPVENRLVGKMAFGKSIIFDGDITTNERIRQLANHLYPVCYLVIRKFGSMENNKRFEYILNYLNKFTKVFVFSDIEYLDMLKKHPKVIVVDNHDFMKQLDGEIIYHYSGYYRSFQEYNEKNLIKLENERYKIMKPED